MGLFKDFEIIIVNDGSSDHSIDIIKEYVQRYPQIISCIDQKNQGVIDARNNGISQATGEYIFPLDGDDKITPTCLEKLYDAIKNGKGDVIHSNATFFGARNGESNPPEPTKYNMLCGNCVHASALFRKEDWERYGGYDRIMRGGWEDWEFWLNFIEENKTFFKINEPLLLYRISNLSRNSLLNKSKIRKLKWIAFKKHKRLLLAKIGYFFYYRKITRRGWLLIKICKIPIPVDVEHGDNNVKYRIHKIPLTVFEVENKKGKRIYKVFGIPCFFRNN